LLLLQNIFECNQSKHPMLKIYNTLKKEKQDFVPIKEGKVGMYVCGPTLYSEPHMGNLRTFVNFDMIYRYLLWLGYDVKYVRNITDAGHITNSAGETLDNIGLAAKKEQLQSLEIVYRYNTKFQELQRLYNLLPPSIEPTATGHIQEQIEIIEKIMENGMAYEVNGAVYFDVKKYMENNHYGELSGRKVDELIEESRSLNAQDEKRFFADFALWKKAGPDDMQIWRSPWGNGNPGWHIECTAMSTKYLGDHFDIHGGGMDLKFPHHEAEIAQNCSSKGCNPANYWMHANMLNVNGKKMSKSLGNSFLPKEIIEGTTALFSKPFSAEVVRFFMMMSHYRSELDFSNEALLAAEKGYDRLTQAFKHISELKVGLNNDEIDLELQKIASDCKENMNDDFNTSKTIASLFELASLIYKVHGAMIEIGTRETEKMHQIIKDFFVDILGLNPNQNQTKTDDSEGMMNVILALRAKAREQKDWATSDLIRDQLAKINIEIKDGKEGSSWRKMN